MTVTTRPEATTAAVDGVLATVREHAARYADEQACFPADALAALRASGLLGLSCRRNTVAAAAASATWSTVSERLAREDMSVALIFAMHCQQAEALVRFAGASCGPRCCRGSPGARSTSRRSPPSAARVATCSPQGPRWSGGTGCCWLDRDAPIVTGAGDADGFLVTMRAPDADSPTQVSLVYADRAQLEVTVAGAWQPLGMRASHSLPLQAGRRDAGAPGGRPARRLPRDRHGRVRPDGAPRLGRLPGWAPRPARSPGRSRCCAPRRDGVRTT